MTVGTGVEAKFNLSNFNGSNVGINDGTNIWSTLLKYDKWNNKLSKFHAECDRFSSNVKVCFGRL
jgi:hypothetical protein